MLRILIGANTLLAAAPADAQVRSPRDTMSPLRKSFGTSNWLLSSSRARSRSIRPGAPCDPQVAKSVDAKKATARPSG